MVMACSRCRSSVSRSPAGITFCVVPHDASRRPRPVSWAAGLSLVDQVCLDLPGPAVEAEAQFWSDTRGWTTLMDLAGRPYCVTSRNPATGRLP